MCVARCVYCGEPATGEDHIPPRAYMRDIRHRQDVNVRHIFIKQFTVPACIRCNNILGDAPIFDVETRRRLVQTHLLKAKEQRNTSKSG